MSNKYEVLKSSSDTYNGKSISIDLDGVCVKTRDAFLSEIEDKHNITISRDVLYGTNPDIPDTDLSFSEAVQNIVKDSFDIYSEMKPMSGAPRSTNMLSREFQIKIVTHRVSENWLSEDKRIEMMNITKKWLNRNNIVYDKFVYPTPEDKSNVESDIFIDDRPEIISKVAEKKNKRGILFLRPHNLENISSLTSADNLSSDSPQDLAKNPRKQWSVIVDSLLSNN